MADQSQGGLMGIDPDLVMQMGLGLMSAAKYGGNVGDSLAGAYQSYQSNQMRKLQMQRMQAQLPLIQAASRAAQGGMPQMGTMPQGGVPQAPGMTPAGPAPQGAPQGAPPAPQAQQGPQGLMSDPFRSMEVGALMDMGGIGGQGMTELGKAQLQYNPQLATQIEAAKGALAVDQQQIKDAIAQGNRPLAEAIYNGKFQQDLGLLHISSMGGIQTRIDPRTGQISTLNPSTGIESQGNQASLMPGMAPALQQKAAAEAQGEATGKITMLTDDAKGSHTGTPFAQYPVAVSSITGGGGGQRAPSPTTPGAGTPPPPSGGPISRLAPPSAPTSPIAELGPGTVAMLHGNAQSAVEANKEYQSQAEAGQSMLVQTQQLRQAAADFPPGQFAGNRMKFLQYLNSAGLITPEQAKSLGSAQEGTKIAIQLQAAATKQLGSREAAQIFQIMGKSLPNLELSQNGLDKVSGYMDGIARYNMARAQVAQQRAAANDANGVNNVRNDFIKNSNPAYFVVASAPPAIQREMIQSMKERAPKFLRDWNAAAKNGWAPRPGDYVGP